MSGEYELEIINDAVDDWNEYNSDFDPFSINDEPRPDFIGGRRFTYEPYKMDYVVDKNDVDEVELLSSFAFVEIESAVLDVVPASNPWRAGHYCLPLYLPFFFRKEVVLDFFFPPVGFSYLTKKVVNHLGIVTVLNDVVACNDVTSILYAARRVRYGLYGVLFYLVNAQGESHTFRWDWLGISYVGPCRYCCYYVLDEVLDNIFILNGNIDFVILSRILNRQVGEDLFEYLSISLLDNLALDLLIDGRIYRMSSDLVVVLDCRDSEMFDASGKSYGVALGTKNGSYYCTCTWSDFVPLCRTNLRSYSTAHIYNLRRDCVSYFQFLSKIRVPEESGEVPYQAFSVKIANSVSDFYPISEYLPYIVIGNPKWKRSFREYFKRCPRLNCNVFWNTLVKHRSVMMVGNSSYYSSLPCIKYRGGMFCTSSFDQVKSKYCVYRVNAVANKNFAYKSKIITFKDKRQYLVVLYVYDNRDFDSDGQYINRLLYDHPDGVPSSSLVNFTLVRPLDHLFAKIKYPRSEIIDYLFYRPGRTHLCVKFVYCIDHNSECMLCCYDPVVPERIESIYRCTRGKKASFVLFREIYDYIVARYCVIDGVVHDFTGSNVFNRSRLKDLTNKS